MRINKLLIGIVALFMATGCALDFDEIHKVEYLRVLGVQAEPPEIAPGEGTIVSVLWADPEGDGRDVEFVWWICAGFVFGADLESCYMVAPPIRLPASEGGDRLEIPVTPEDILDEIDMPDGMGYMNITFVGLLCGDGELPSDDVLADPEGYEHIDDICEGGEAVSFFRTLLLSESDDPQRNPDIERVEYRGDPLVPLEENGEALTLQCNETENCELDVPLDLYMTEGSLQTYETVEIDEVVDVQEKLFVSWYVTGGMFEEGYRSMVDEEEYDDPEGPFENVWQPEEPGLYTLYVVAHDTRGGTSWRTYSFDIEPAK